MQRLVSSPFSSKQQNGSRLEGEQGTHRMFLLLHIQDGPIFERPLHNVRLWGCTLYMLTLLELAPKFVDVLELDEVPDLAKGGGDDGGFGDGGRSWDGGRHLGKQYVEFVEFDCCWRAY